MSRLVIVFNIRSFENWPVEDTHHIVGFLLYQRKDFIASYPFQNWILKCSLSDKPFLKLQVFLLQTFQTTTYQYPSRIQTLWREK